MDQAEREEMYKMLYQLKKHDPLRRDQRAKLVESIRTLNQQMGIGVKLAYPRPRGHVSVPPSPK